MAQRLNRQGGKEKEPVYGLIWNHLKRFPKGLSEGSKNPPAVSGPAAAALISTAIGCFTMMVTHHLSETSPVREQIIWAIGSWMPGSNNPSELWGNIGSYSGKETMLLVGWLLSWLILYWLWKDRNIKFRTIFFWFFVLMLAATTMSWHPLFPYLPLT